MKKIFYWKFPPEKFTIQRIIKNDSFRRESKWEHEARVRPWEWDDGKQEEKVAEEEKEEAVEKLAVRLWAKGRRVAAAVTAAHFPILFVGPFLSSEWSLTSTLQVLLGIGASKNPSLFPLRSELNLPYARSVANNIDRLTHSLISFSSRDTEEKFISKACPMYDWFSEEIFDFEHLY